MNLRFSDSFGVAVRLRRNESLRHGLDPRVGVKSMAFLQHRCTREFSIRNACNIGRSFGAGHRCIGVVVSRDPDPDPDPEQRGSAPFQ